MDELWKPIEWNGVLLYVSNTGKIKDAKGKEKPINKSFKYDRICVKGKWALVHRVVATAFIPNPDGLETVDHIDENKHNNHVDNLEWCTRQNNSLRRHKKSGTYVVEQCDLSGRTVSTFISQAEAARVTGIHREAINMCCAGRRKTAGGFCWIYTRVV